MKTQRGFTLVEIMIAVLISAILAVMAFEAMQQALNNRERVRAAELRVQAVQNTMRSFVQDFSQLTPRPVREPLGSEYQPAVLARTTTSTEVSLTRGGWMNPAALSRSAAARALCAARGQAVPGLLDGARRAAGAAAAIEGTAVGRQVVPAALHE
jgi:general secretion pathway protein J